MGLTTRQGTVAGPHLRRPQPRASRETDPPAGLGLGGAKKPANPWGGGAAGDKVIIWFGRGLDGRMGEKVMDTED